MRFTELSGPSWCAGSSWSTRTSGRSGSSCPGPADPQLTETIIRASSSSIPWTSSLLRTLRAITTTGFSCRSAALAELFNPTTISTELFERCKWVTLCYPVSPWVTLRHLASLCVTMRHRVSFCVTLSHLESSCVTLSHLESSCVTLSHLVSPCVTLCHLESPCVTSCHFVSPWYWQLGSPRVTKSAKFRDFLELKPVTYY